MATNYEFQGSLYNSPRQLAHAIAGEWLSAGGANPLDFIRQSLADTTDAELADEAIKGWGLDQHIEKYWVEDEDEKSITWMSDRDLTSKDIEDAFKALRDPAYFQDCFGHMEPAEA